MPNNRRRSRQVVFVSLELGLMLTAHRFLAVIFQSLSPEAKATLSRRPWMKLARVDDTQISTRHQWAGPREETIALQSGVSQYESGLRKEHSRLRRMRKDNHLQQRHLEMRLSALVRQQRDLQQEQERLERDGAYMLRRGRETTRQKWVARRNRTDLIYRNADAIISKSVVPKRYHGRGRACKRA